MYAKKGKKVEKKQATLQEDYRIVDDENKNLAIRLRARERLTENRQQLDDL